MFRAGELDFNSFSVFFWFAFTLKKAFCVCVCVCVCVFVCLLLFPQDIASQKFAMPSPVRTVIVADFDNDNELEVFFNNIAYRGPSANRLFRYSHI